MFTCNRILLSPNNIGTDRTYLIAALGVLRNAECPALLDLIPVEPGSAF
jgi:hypothetical protein